METRIEDPAFELTAAVTEYVAPFPADETPIEEPAPPFLVADLPLFATEEEFVDFTRYTGMPADAPAWWDGYTEVPEGYLWPWEVAEIEAQAAMDAWMFSEEMYALFPDLVGVEFALV